MEIKICDAPGCARPGKLVQQFVAKCKDLDPFIFRTYFCQWHLASQNRYRLNNQHMLYIIEHKTDDEVFKEVTMGARGPKPKPPPKIKALPTPRQQRPMPLRGMSEKSRAVWMKIINAYPIDFFKPQHLGLLRMYCEADALAKIAQHEAGKVNFTDTNPKSLVTKPSHWLNIKSQAVSESLSLATKLGITKNNTTAARGEKGSNPKPESKRAGLLGGSD